MPSNNMNLNMGQNNNIGTPSNLNPIGSGNNMAGLPNSNMAGPFNDNM